MISTAACLKLPSRPWKAIRLFLFLKNTAFVIAADDSMIKCAVHRHFPDVTDDLVINILTSSCKCQFAYLPLAPKKFAPT